jgi:hypothetical protein
MQVWCCICLCNEQASHQLQQLKTSQTALLGATNSMCPCMLAACLLFCGPDSPDKPLRKRSASLAWSCNNATNALGLQAGCECKQYACSSRSKRSGSGTAAALGMQVTHPLLPCCTLLGQGQKSPSWNTSSIAGYTTRQVQYTSKCRCARGQAASRAGPCMAVRQKSFNKNRIC